MRLLEFKITKDEMCPDKIGTTRYVVKLSTDNERELYERTNAIADSCKAADEAYEEWDKRLKAHLNVSDKLVAYYIMDDEKEPKIGGKLKIGDIELRRMS